MKGLIVSLLLVSVSAAAPAAPDWSLTDISGTTHRPFAAPETRGLVLVFIATDCPIANYFQPTLKRLHQAYAKQGVSFLLLHPDPDTSAEDAAAHAKAFSISAPVVLDPEQAVARRVKAAVTPEAFVIDPAGTVRYRGRINDTYVGFGKKRAAPTTHDLKAALDAVLAGKPVAVPKTRAIGCYLPELETK